MEELLAGSNDVGIRSTSGGDGKHAITTQKLITLVVFGKGGDEQTNSWCQVLLRNSSSLFSLSIFFSLGWGILEWRRKGQRVSLGLVFGGWEMEGLGFCFDRGGNGFEMG